MVRLVRSRLEKMDIDVRLDADVFDRLVHLAQ